jgi:hypothetical protein
LILTLASGTWTPTEVSLPAGANSNPGANLRSVSCVAAGSCAAVGNYEDASLDFRGLLLTDNSGTWTTTKATLPMNAAADPAVSLASVSCVGTLDCAAAGKYLPSGGEAQALLIGASNGSWATGTEATLPAGGVTAQPNAISCASAGNCTAVGYYVDPMNAQHGLLLTETGGSWANGVEAPLPPGATNPSVLAVSCWAPGNCGAAGDDGLDGLLLGESDGTWSATDATLPSGGTLGDLSAVSCPGPAICAAGGEYRNSSTNNNEGLLVSAPASSLASPSLALAAPATATVGTAIAPSSISGSLSGASAPTGSVSFTVFGPQFSPPTNCSSGGTAVGSGGAGGVTGIHPSAGFTPTSAGNYWWYASYSGDAGNNPASSPCGAGMPETVVAASSGGTPGGGTPGGGTPGGGTPGGGTPGGGTPGGGAGKAAGSVLAPQKPRASGQRVSETMTCRGTGACPVTVKLTVTEKVKGKGKSHRQKVKTVVLGSKSATIAAGHSETVTVSLNTAGKRLLALHHALAAKLSVVFEGKTVGAFTVTFRAAPHHKK